MGCFKFLLGVSFMFFGLVSGPLVWAQGFGLNSPPEVIVVDLDSAAYQNNNIPNSNVIDILDREFEESKSILSTGDLALSSRWACREFFAHDQGANNYRFRSFSFSSYSTGIFEDELNQNYKYYTMSNLTLISQSSLRAGRTQEVRIDAKGNLRMVEKEGSRALSYLVCLKKNRTP